MSASSDFHPRPPSTRPNSQIKSSSRRRHYERRDSDAIVERREAGHSPISPLNQYAVLPPISPLARSDTDLTTSSQSSSILAPRQCLSPSNSLSGEDRVSSGASGRDRTRNRAAHDHPSSDPSSSGDHQPVKGSRQRQPKRELKAVGKEPISSEDKITLAIRLPDGTKLTNTFFASDTVRGILDFVSQNVNKDFSAYGLFSHDPRCIYNSPEQTLGAYNIGDKTALYLELPE